MRHLLKKLKPLVAPLAVAGVAALLIYSVRIGQVVGISMEPALHDGQHVVIDTLTWHITGVHKGDILVFANPHDPKTIDIKRVAATPGGRGEIKGTVVPLGKDDYYLIGDNFSHSTDSRAFGAVQPGNIIGRVVYSW